MAALLMEMEEKLQKQAFKRVFAELHCFVKHFCNAKTIYMWLQRKSQLELVVSFLLKQNLFVIIFADHWDATWLDFLSVMKWWKEYQRNVFSYVNCWFCETLNYVCSLVVILLDAQPTDNTSRVVDCKKFIFDYYKLSEKMFWNRIQYQIRFLASKEFITPAIYINSSRIMELAYKNCYIIVAPWSFWVKLHSYVSLYVLH